MLCDATGRPGATKHRFGKGTAYYYATALSLGYFRHPKAEVRRWIVAPAVERNAALPVEMTERIGTDRISRDGGPFATHSNSGKLGSQEHSNRMVSRRFPPGGGSPRPDRN